ncbi:predicted protein [Firmicutes bacterium CAG:822]|nr:predicted protein [Firmicutes bacterium CAG:822]
MKKDKIFIHFDTNDISIYQLNQKKIKLLKKKQVFFNETLVNDELLKKIDRFLSELKNIVGTVDNERVRLYATGVFQEFSKEEQMQLIIHVFVSSGLYFNIVQPDLENFYLDRSFEISGKRNMFDGLINQEFRKVVICGSFQQHMQEIGAVIECLKKHNIQVLSPWTMNIVPETVGTDFILLEGQELINERDAWSHKYDHMNKFKKVDAIIVCNPDGKIGKGTMFEFGFMVAYAKRIIFINEPKELSILFPYEVGLNFD